MIQAPTANTNGLPFAGSIFAHLLLATATPVRGLQETSEFGDKFRYESVAEPHESRNRAFAASEMGSKRKKAFKVKIEIGGNYVDAIEKPLN